MQRKGDASMFSHGLLRSLLKMESLLGRLRNTFIWIMEINYIKLIVSQRSEVCVHCLFSWSKTGVLVKQVQTKKWSHLLTSSVFLACTQPLVYFSFRSVRKHRRARSARKNDPWGLRSLNPSRFFIFYHARLTDWWGENRGSVNRQAFFWGEGAAVHRLLLAPTKVMHTLNAGAW